MEMGKALFLWRSRSVLKDECSHPWRGASGAAIKMLFGSGKVSCFPRSQNRDLGHPALCCSMNAAAVLVCLALGVSSAAAAAGYDAEAVRLNNRGVALMGQQFTVKAAESFAASFKKDPMLAQAE